MTTWSTISTATQTRDEILDFVAFMKLHGAGEIALYFLDPNHPAIHDLEAVDNVKITLCDAQYWDEHGGAPDDLSGKKSRNLADAYAKAQTDWVIALDCNEWLGADDLIARVLAAQSENRIELPPYERFENRRDGVGGNADALFRPALSPLPKGIRLGNKCYGKDHYAASHRGLLGALAGAYVITSGQNLAPEDFDAIINGTLKAAPPEPKLRLLRNYALSFEAWITATGQAKTPALRAQYQAINVYDRTKAPLQRRGIAFPLFAWLADYRAEIFGHEAGGKSGSNPAPATPYFHDIAMDEASGKIEGDINWDGLKMRLRPQGNYTELRLSRGSPPEAEEHAIIKSLVEGKRARLYDVGGNAGVYSLRVAQYADPKSKITAYEPNPEMAHRLERNARLNGFENITIKEAAVSDEAGFVSFAVHATNLGQSRVVEEDTGFQVPTLRLLDEIEDPKDYDLSLLKVDVEGFEPMVFASLFSVPASAVHWPNFILMEQAHSQGWRDALFENLKHTGYEVYYQNKLNIIWQHK